MKKEDGLNKKIVISFILTLILLVLSIVFYKENILFFVSSNTYIIYLLFVLFFIIIVKYFHLIIKEKNKKIIEVINLMFFTANLISVIIFLNLFICTTAKVDGTSMQPNYNHNETILISQTFYSVNKGDVVIIDCNNLPVSTDLIIKRVVATSNDKVEYKDNGLFVNDVFVEEMSYSQYYNILRNFSENVSYTEIPEGYYIVLGDNRNNSTDSRTIGLISEKEIIGKSIFRIFPLSSFGKPS